MPCVLHADVPNCVLCRASLETHPGDDNIKVLKFSFAFFMRIASVNNLGVFGLFKPEVNLLQMLA